MSESSREILILDPLPAAGSHTIFLLQLAGHRVKKVRESDEAINWILHRQRNMEVPDLLLINNFSPRLLLSTLLFELRKAGLKFPILIVDRLEQPDRREELLNKVRSHPHIHICHPNFVLEKVSECLSPKGEDKTEFQQPQLPH